MKKKFVIRVWGFISRWFSFMLFKINHPFVMVILKTNTPGFYSQDGQDAYLLGLLFKIIDQRKENWIVDVGCNHPVHFSNSLFFEKYMGCNVLAVDAIEEFGALWEVQRPAADFVYCAVGGASETTVLHVNPQDSMLSFVSGGLSKESDTLSMSKVVPCKRLSELLFERNISEVLFLSVDVEGFELEVVKTINFNDVFIKCMCIENNSNGLFGSEELRYFLESRGYVFYARLSLLDDVFIHRSLLNGIAHSNISIASAGQHWVF